MKEVSKRLAENLAAVRERMAAAAARVGRPANEIKLVAVTKYVEPDVAGALFDAGCLDLGESRPQELWRKAEALAGRGVRWHFIGHLQRNKVQRTLPFVSMLHSVDSTRLLAELDREAARLSRRLPILLEMNISGDDTKHGFQPAEASEAFSIAMQFAHLDVRGLMGMASREGDLEAARDEFQRLRDVRDQLRVSVAEDSQALPELSMGMSGDFEVAIEAGATMVRVGSLLFEGIVS